MATEVVMPKLGATMEQGTIVSWLASVGEEIEEGDPIAEVQTDKIVMEVEAETTGILLKTLFEEGTEVAVHEVIAYLGEEGEDVEELAPTESQKKTIESTPHVRSNKKIRRTPAARALAEKHQISLEHVAGSGPNGRIQKADVEQFIAANSKKITPLAKKIAEESGIDLAAITGTGTNGKIVKADLSATSEVQDRIKPQQTADKRVPFKGMRKVIAERMADSAYTAPHVTLTSEIDMTNCVTLRQELLPLIESENGYRVSFNDIIVKATAHTLQRHPAINLSLDRNEIVYHEAIHIGFAVALENGLVVPVVKNANLRGLANITAECKELAKLARDRKLLPEQMLNGTFTISNLGMYEVDGFTPIINQPEAAILGVGRIQEKPVAYQGELALRKMMTLSLSFDHRIIDGAPAAAFLTELKEVLEIPYKLLV